ncbi:putative bifunctional diguanylate cyclase/phosphodiesterase [Actinoalloteichus hymeniacidonis]|uniref:Diguanylate cyclase (GGDEF) domain-containing protein n=1 Tax=Actinoalloteichus hymeniacidonis TaxID=340345 RepID=A0AAC9HLN3_9PSEU|nr:EAL domain-containing protein [Actinoalloteichus hymeniacidonis]AOS61404.1 diguanylate cyclase (GGDEF) domain-containing protein [Actinoalloteichus hymeniacidonis]MBB5910591.1 diguanylate cyclase (GGDEF)-like protein [Actinoalloteichus hymeniacidonis]
MTETVGQISEVESAGSPPPPRTEEHQRSFRLFSYLLLTVGVLASVVVGVAIPSDFGTELYWTAPLLAIGFLLAERFTIHVDVNRVGWTVSFTEIPLVIGLLIAPFEIVLIAHLLAGMSMLMGTLISRRAYSHAIYNAGVMCLEVAVPFAMVAVFGRVLADVGPEWLPVMLGALFSPLISMLLALMAMRMLGGEVRFSGAVRMAAYILAVGLLNTSVGLVGFELADQAPWGWALLVFLCLAVAAFYRAYSGLLRERRDLEALSDVSLTVARSGQQAGRPAGERALEVGQSREEWQSITDRIRDQLNATRVVLHLRLAPDVTTLTVVSGEALSPDALPCGELRDDPLLQLPGTQVRYFRAIDAVEEVRCALQKRGAYEALVVPLRGAHQLLGAVEVHDRISRWRGFGHADIRLLRTLASHLATTMDNRRLLGRLRHDAYHDPLTGLLNRPGFRETADARIHPGCRVAVLRLDLDVLSTVSDALGHAWSDRMVVAAGKRIRDVLGDDAPLARLESGSFAALAIDRSDEELAELAELLLVEIARPYPVDRLTVEASAVVGYACFDEEALEEGSPADALLQQADVAMRAARTGDAGVRRYAPSMGQIFLRRFQLVTQFRQALDTGQVEVHFQPKIALRSRAVVGVEALVRWVHPEFGRLDPDEFVPAVEATGLVDALTSFVMERALIEVRGWLDRGLRISAAVNLSVRNLADETFPERVGEALRRHEVPPQLLTFELTESGVMSDPERALPVLRRLHALGVVLAVDDFGTGYSSLAYLRQLPVDEVKIDKSFVFGMGSDLSDMAVVRSIIELGHSLGLVVVAEGVEEDAVRDQLVEMGCDIAQGYLISRPLPLDRFEAWLQARTVRVRGLYDETVLTLVG